MKIAMVIAFRNFRDEEYFIPVELFEKSGFNVTTFSVALGTAIGMNGGEVEVQKLLDEFSAQDFDAAVFVGGEGARSLIENADAHNIAQETASSGKVLGAICIAPVILAKAGVLFKKKATVWSSSMDKSAIKILREEDAVYVDGQIVVDGKIVTANDPAAAEKFGEKVLEILTPLTTNHA